MTVGVFLPGARVLADADPGTVIKDERFEVGGVAARGVWVLLDAGANPQSFAPGQLRPA